MYAVAITVRTFLKRKIITGGKDGTKKDGTSMAATARADTKLVVFKRALVADFTAALGKGAGDEWFASHVEPIAKELRAQL